MTPILPLGSACGRKRFEIWRPPDRQFFEIRDQFVDTELSMVWWNGDAPSFISMRDALFDEMEDSQ